MGYDHATCPNCGSIWQFDGFVEQGEVIHCDNCARDFRAGQWWGKSYRSLFGSLFRAPQCPQCSGTNSGRGVQVGFYSIRLYLRQCRDCWSTWIARK